MLSTAGEGWFWTAAIGVASAAGTISSGVSSSKAAYLPVCRVAFIGGAARDEPVFHSRGG